MTTRLAAFALVVAVILPRLAYSQAVEAASPDADVAAPASEAGSGSDESRTTTDAPAPQASEADSSYAVAGSIQLDFLGVPTDSRAREHVFDGTTAEISLKLTKELGPRATAVVKVCFACHGFEAAMGFVELRATDAVRVRLGRLTPAFGSFPQRHDPANHTTSDKPLPYDMGRMLHRTSWNEGILPAPWVDNGIELAGTHFWKRARVDYAVWAVSGPKGSPDASDLDFALSRAPEQYYVDNNSRPSGGGRLAMAIDLAEGTSLGVGLSAMAGHYDPQRELAFALGGMDVVLTMARAVIRAEYLIRRTEVALGLDPAQRFRFGPGADGTYADFFVKEGFYAEVEVPVGKLSLLARWDGLRRRGNVVIANPLDEASHLFRYTAALGYRVLAGIQLKSSIEVYESREFGRDLALHLGLATAF